MKISEIRKQYPQYKELSDKELADALHDKFYPDMPLGDFYERIGLAKSGIGAAVMKGLESYASQARTALSGASEESARAGIARGEKISSEYAAQADPEKVIKAYEEKGLLPAVGTAATMVPYAVAEQTPTLASSIAGAQLGQKLGRPFGGVGRLAGAGLGALAGRFAASYLPQAGGNIEEQARAQIERGEPVNISGLKAYGTAVPQAAIDTATQGLLVGGRGILAKLLGTTETSLARKSAAEVEKLAQEKIFTTLAKGTAIGTVAEIPGEVLQDMMTRAQAGEEITSPEAIKGYGRTAISAALLAPVGGVSRVAQRSGARGEIEQQQEIARQEAQMLQLQEEETKKEQDRIAKETAKQEAEAAKQQAIAAKAEAKRLAQARKLGTPELLAQMGDETIVDYDNKGVSKYSLLPDAERARTEQLNSLAPRFCKLPTTCMARSKS